MIAYPINADFCAYADHGNVWVGLTRVGGIHGLHGQPIPNWCRWCDGKANWSGVGDWHYFDMSDVGGDQNSIAIRYLGGTRFEVNSIPGVLDSANDAGEYCNLKGPVS